MGWGCLPERHAGDLRDGLHPKLMGGRPGHGRCAEGPGPRRSLYLPRAWASLGWDRVCGWVWAPPPRSSPHLAMFWATPGGVDTAPWPHEAPAGPFSGVGRTLRDTTAHGLALGPEPGGSQAVCRVRGGCAAPVALRPPRSGARGNLRASCPCRQPGGLNDHLNEWVSE